MRMRNRDGADAAACVYLSDCFVVQQRDAVPEQISSGRLQKQSALAYGKFRFGTHAQKLWRFIFANWTTRRWFRSLSKLRPALHADKVFHDKIARRGLLQRTLRNTSSSGTEMISDVTLPPASFTKRNVRS